MSNVKSCAYCAHRYTRDYGYSNYTVEGTDIGCRKNLNLDYPAPDPSGYLREESDPPHTFAEKCPEYTEGDGIHFCCEDDFETDADGWVVAPPSGE